MSEYKPSLGVEIELPWIVMLHQVHQNTSAKLLRESEGYYALSDDEKAVVQRGFVKVDEQYRPKVARANELGIPSGGNDGYTRFALHPRANPQEIVRDVDTLYNLGLLSEKSHYPLHVTIGNIGATASAAYLLCSMEIMGDIHPPRFSQKHTSTIKDSGSVERRMAQESSLGDKKSVELHTLELHRRMQLRDVLTTAHLGAQAIVNKDPLWRSWRRNLEHHLDNEGLPVNALWKRSDASTWKKYRELLDTPDWRNEAKRIIGRHAALLRVLADEHPARNQHISGG